MRYHPAMVVKRYSNRRLYDTGESRYVTLDEVATRIRQGEDVQFVDAPSGDDITQSFLAQIILESRGAARLLPVPLLYRMVRMGDDALAEFFGRYVTWALDVYLKTKQSARTMAAANPFAALPLAATDAFMRWLGGWTQPPAPPPTQSPWMPPGSPSAGPGPAPDFPPPPVPGGGDGAWASAADARDTRQDSELAALRAELDGLKRLLRDALGPRGDSSG